MPERQPGSFRKLAPTEEADIAMKLLTLRAMTRGKANIDTAPCDAREMDRAWQLIVQYPVSDEGYEWLVYAFVSLLAEHFYAVYGLEWRELEDANGVAACLLHERTQIVLFPFDTVAKKIEEESPGFFEQYLSEIQALFQQHGVAPHNPPLKRKMPAWLQRV